MPRPHEQAGKHAQEVPRSSAGVLEDTEYPPIWRSKWARRVCSLLCLIVAVAVEWKLVNMPAGEVNGQFPPSVRARDEIVTFTEPASMTGDPFSFAYAPSTEAEKVLVDAFFDNAQLSSQTLQALKSLQVSAPASSAAITYLTSGAGNAVCATKVRVEPSSANLKSVQFSQDSTDVTSGYRMLGTTFAGAGAEVTLISQGAFQNGLSPCRIELSVGDWKQFTQGFLPIKIQVPPAAPFRFHWQKLDENSDSWKKKSLAQSLLGFGPTSSDEFSAQSIAISPLDPKTGAPQPPHFEAQGEKKAPLTVQSFGINQNQLEFKVSGKGKVLKDGKGIPGRNALETINKNPILSALFAAGNLALIGWVGRLFFPSKPKRYSGA